MASSDSELRPTGTKRIRPGSTNSSDDTPQIFQLPNEPVHLRELVKKPNYVHLFVPKDLADSLTSFLSKTSVVVDRNLHSTVTIHPDGTSLNVLNETFIKQFKKVKSTLANHMRKFSHKQFLNELDPTDLEAFRTYRTQISKWYTHCQHLENKIIFGNTATNRHLKLATQFSPSVKDRRLKDQCTDKLAAVREDIEISLHRSVVEHALTTNDSIADEINNLLTTESNLFIICKAFRTVLLHNRKIAGKLIDDIPRDPDLSPSRRRPQRPFHNQRSHTSSSSTRYEPQRGHHTRNHQPDHSRYFQHSRTGAAGDSRKSHIQEARDSSYQRPNPRFWANQRQTISSPQPSHFSASEDLESDNGSFASEYYDSEFPRYDNNTKQRKPRFHIPYREPDDIFRPYEGRPPPRQRSSLKPSIQWLE